MKTYTSIIYGTCVKNRLRVVMLEVDVAVVIVDAVRRGTDQNERKEEVIAPLSASAVLNFGALSF